MARHGKKYNEGAKLIESTREYDPQEAISLAKQVSYVNFDETVELHLHMGLDPRHADQQVRGVASLPHGLGKQVRVLVFAQGEGVKILGTGMGTGTRRLVRIDAPVRAGIMTVTVTKGATVRCTPAP